MKNSVAVINVRESLPVIDVEDKTEHKNDDSHPVDDEKGGDASKDASYWNSLYGFVVFGPCRRSPCWPSTLNGSLIVAAPVFRHGNVRMSVALSLSFHFLARSTISPQFSISSQSKGILLAPGTLHSPRGRISEIP